MMDGFVVHQLEAQSTLVEAIHAQRRLAFVGLALYSTHSPRATPDAGGVKDRKQARSKSGAKASQAPGKK